MKSSNQHILETLIINKDYIEAKITPKSFYELRKIIEDRYNKLGAGTKQNPIDFNDIDVSNMNSFYSINRDIGGIFERTHFKYIDISDWDVSNIVTMQDMFCNCVELKSAGDISKWDVSNVTDMTYMFFDCKKFNQDISGWNVSNVIDMTYMFYRCKNFNQDLSEWDVSKVAYMNGMFYRCKSFNRDLSKWNVSSVTDADDIFYDCSIKSEYKPKFK